MNPVNKGARASYRDATSHYTSPTRRDPVKTILEEVVSHRVLRDAVARLPTPRRKRLRVLDVGCGTGDGLALLTDPHGELPPVVEDNQLDYLGIDLDPDMIETARSVHAGRSARFDVADMRADPAAGDFDLYLSCGVPYSHLPHDAVVEVLTRLMERIVDTHSGAVIVVDVLGRYSIEWTPHWPRTRWPYNMSFFESSTETIHDQMSFFDRRSLSDALAMAATCAHARLRHVTFTDRSIVVGRHTATRAFNPVIPPYRNLINELARGGTDVTCEQLRIRPPSGDAPPQVIAFFREFALRWNNAIVTVTEGRGRPVSSRQAVRLAAALLSCEQHIQQGLGVGHSLIATAVVERARTR